MVSREGRPQLLRILGLLRITQFMWRWKKRRYRGDCYGMSTCRYSRGSNEEVLEDARIVLPRIPRRDLFDGLPVPFIGTFNFSKSGVPSTQVQSKSVSVVLLSSGPATIAAEDPGYFGRPTISRQLPHCRLGQKDTPLAETVSAWSAAVSAQVQAIENSIVVGILLLLTCTCWRVATHLRGEIDSRLTSP